MENIIVSVQPEEVHERLTALGVSEEALRGAVARGQLAFANCTPNYPPMFPAIAAWAETVGALRENLAILGWTRSDENNYSRAIDPAGRIAIAVATGDDGTGLEEATPSTKTAKGPSTLEAVVTNQVQLALFEDTSPAVKTEGENERVTWLLLMYRTSTEVRCELSLPVAIGADMRVDQWRERIILRSIPLDDEPDEIRPPELPDFNIEVQRRS